MGGESGVASGGSGGLFVLLVGRVVVIPMAKRKIDRNDKSGTVVSSTQTNKPQTSHTTSAVDKCTVDANTPTVVNSTPSTERSAGGIMQTAKKYENL
jgi:hypothetical protein